MPAFFKNYDALPGLLRAARAALKTYRKCRDEDRPQLTKLANEVQHAYMVCLSRYLTERLSRAFPGRHVGYVDLVDAEKFVDRTWAWDLDTGVSNHLVVEQLAVILDDNLFSDHLDRKGV